MLQGLRDHLSPLAMGVRVYLSNRTLKLTTKEKDVFGEEESDPSRTLRVTCVKIKTSTTRTGLQRGSQSELKPMKKYSEGLIVLPLCPRVQ